MYAAVIIIRIAASAPAASSAPEAVKVEEKPKAEEVDALDGGTYSTHAPITSSSIPAYNIYVMICRCDHSVSTHLPPSH